MIYPILTNPTFCTIKPNPIEIHGITTNGIAKIGFKTIGPPKITGSLIPQIPGTTLKRPIDFKCFTLEKHINKTSPNVFPPPPRTA